MTKSILRTSRIFGNYLTFLHCVRDIEHFLRRLNVLAIVYSKILYVNYW